MQRRLLMLVGVLSLALADSTASAQGGPRLVADSGQFLLDGRPFQIISGEMHYARIPREYWRDRLRKARAMGLNTISTYVFWNFHEARPGQFAFTGQADLALFLKTAQEEGLHVILRPGPYVCAEWEWGGFPAWLFADSTMVVRSTDTSFTRPAERWLSRLGREVAPLLASHGGPVIAIQVENEYGSFDRDTAYMRWQLSALERAGLNGVLLYTADGPAQLPNGTLSELPAVVNFGPGSAEEAFAALVRFRPRGPRMSGEYWAGWFDQWGRPHATTSAEQQTRELESMLGRGYSLNLYMFHGGTTFGFMNGANIDSRHYHPQTTSYDYDAALDESGRPTAKFAAFREVIARHTGVTPPALPNDDSARAIPPFSLTPAGSLLAKLPRGVRVERPTNMERFGQGYGYIVYRTTVAQSTTATLVVRDVRDYAVVMVDGRVQGTLDRRLDQDSMTVTARSGARLDILVENTGRVNFAKPLRDERKGITRSVTLGGRELTGWTVVSLPMSSVPVVRPTGAFEGPGYYRGTFRLQRTADSFLDMRGWGKGTVWVNGHHLGRFWGIGPQQTLYVPGPWLRQGANEVVVFDLDRPAALRLTGLATPILDEVHPDDRRR